MAHRPAVVDGFRRWVVVGLFVVGACGAAPRTDPVLETVPEDGCTCERLSGPLVVPTAELPRWKRAKENNRLLVAKLVAVLGGSRANCTRTVDDDLTRVLREHEHVLAENRALKIASCDHFARWEGQSLDEGDVPDLTEQMLALSRPCALSNYASIALSELTVIRTCMTVSMR